MLVLSRKENQKVLFPNLGVTVEIVGFKGSSVKLGVNAPPEIRILRAELADSDSEFDATLPNAANGDSDERMARHQLNNQLNAVGLQMQIAQKLLKRGEHDRAMEALQGSLEQLQTLEKQTGAAKDDAIDKRDVKWRALLVEDNDNERRLMATILNMCGFEVDAVEDGQAAIEYLKTHHQPDCVLMDMEMPRLSGPEAIASIRDQPELQNVPIYGVSGLDRQEANVPIGDRGVSGWFAKPVDTNKLVEQLFQDISAEPAQVRRN